MITDWPKLTLAADEWGSIVDRVELPASVGLTPGEVSTELMREGRKFDIGFVAGAHGFTNKSLGCVGNQEAFLNSFDWIIHMGAFTRKQLPQLYLDRWDEMPMGTNEQGGTFPLCVACEHRASGEIYLLDMRGLAEIVDTQPAPQAPIIPHQRVQHQPDQALLAGMLAESQHVARDTSMSQNDKGATSSQSDATKSDPATVATPNPTEIAFLSMSLSQGRSVSQAARAMKGYNGRRHKEYMAKAEYVKRLIDAQPVSDTPEASADDEDEPPSWFGKAFDG